MIAHTPATTEMEKWLGVRIRFHKFLTPHPIWVRKKNAESSRSRPWYSGTGPTSSPSQRWADCHILQSWSSPEFFVTQSESNYSPKGLKLSEPSPKNEQKMAFQPQIGHSRIQSNPSPVQCSSLVQARDDRIVDFHYPILSCFWKIISVSDPNPVLVEIILSVSENSPKVHCDAQHTFLCCVCFASMRQNNSWNYFCF